MAIKLPKALRRKAPKSSVSPPQGKLDEESSTGVASSTQSTVDDELSNDDSAALSRVSRLTDRSGKRAPEPPGSMVLRLWINKNSKDNSLGTVLRTLPDRSVCISKILNGSLASRSQLEAGMVLLRVADVDLEDMGAAAVAKLLSQQQGKFLVVVAVPDRTFETLDEESEHQGGCLQEPEDDSEEDPEETAELFQSVLAEYKRQTESAAPTVAVPAL